MVASTVVVVPWRDDGSEERAVAFRYCAARWSGEYGWPVACTHDLDGPWRKGEAVRQALDLAGPEAEVVVVADADVWFDGDLRPAVDYAATCAPVVPHGEVWRLSRIHSAAVLAGAASMESARADELEERPYTGLAGGGLVVISRDHYDLCPIDPRFEGWGCEDASWGMALTETFGAMQRGKHRLFHLWHEPQPRRSRQTGSPESEALRRRYRAARGKPVEMARLLLEAARTSV